MTTVEGSLKDNSPTQARPILTRLLVKPFLSVTVSYFMKHYGSRNLNGYPLTRSRFQNFSLVSQNELKEVLTVSNIPHEFPFNEGFLIARRVKQLEWLCTDYYLLRGF